MNVGELEAVALATVDVEHGDGGDGGTEGGEAEDEHRGGVGGIGLVGAAHEHRDDGAAEVLDEEDHGVGGAETFQGDDLWHAGPEGGGGQRVANAERDHQGDGNGGGVHRQGEAEVYGRQHQGTRDHQRHTLAIAVIDESEKGRHEDGAEGRDGGEDARDVGIDAVFHHHQLCGELQKRRDGRVEEHAEERDQPETWIAEGHADVGEAEFLG